MESIIFFYLLLFAYFLGSINSAIIICKLMGLPSPRTTGSGNPGATNVLRLGNKKAAALTLVFDVLKGIVPVAAGRLLHLPAPLLCWIALAAVSGHIFPVFFGFKGGKGVATAIGALFAVHIVLGLAIIATWLIFAKLFKLSSLASLIALVLAPLYAYFIFKAAVLFPLIVLTILIIVRHKSNLERIFKGEESQIK